MGQVSSNPLLASCRKRLLPGVAAKEFFALDQVGM